MSALEVSNVTMRFGGLLALNDVSFTVQPGSLAALIGPNGAGKTTLFNAVTNLFRPTSGSVNFYGRSLAGLEGAAIARLGLIRTFQTARVFPGMTALENVLVGAHLKLHRGLAAQAAWLPGVLREERAVVQRAEAFLELAGLSHIRNVPATELPMGVQKTLEVIRALMAEPKMVLLDEPAAGLNDSETSDLASLLRAVQQCGITVLVVEHNMTLVMRIAEQVIVLDAGQLLTIGTPDEVRADARVIEAYLGKEDHA
jgi:branched-chain amino acid transport system ATP-binding protein